MNQKSHPPKSLKLVTPGSAQSEAPQSTYKPLNRVEPRLGIPSEFGSVPRPATFGLYIGAMEGLPGYTAKMPESRRKAISPLIWLFLALAAFGLVAYGFHAVTDLSTIRLSREARLYEHQAFRPGSAPSPDVGLSVNSVNAPVPGDMNNAAEQASAKTINVLEEADAESLTAIAEQLKGPPSSMSLSLNVGRPIPPDALRQHKKTAASGETVGLVMDRINGVPATASRKQTARALVSSPPQFNNAYEAKSDKGAQPPISSCTKAMIAMRLCEADEQ